MNQLDYIRTKSFVVIAIFASMTLISIGCSDVDREIDGAVGGGDRAADADTSEWVVPVLVRWGGADGATGLEKAVSLGGCP